MKRRPFEHQRHGSPREIASEDGERLYLNEGLVFAIFGVKMCRTVVCKVHSDHNPKESSHLGHFFFRFYALRKRGVRSRVGRQQPFRDRNTPNPFGCRPDCRGRRAPGLASEPAERYASPASPLKRLAFAADRGLHPSGIFELRVSRVGIILIYGKWRL